jgi:hypothetical protein
VHSHERRLGTSWQALTHAHISPLDGDHWCAVGSTDQHASIGWPSAHATQRDFKFRGQGVAALGRRVIAESATARTRTRWRIALGELHARRVCARSGQEQRMSERRMQCGSGVCAGGRLCRTDGSHADQRSERSDSRRGVCRRLLEWRHLHTPTRDRSLYCSDRACHAAPPRAEAHRKHASARLVRLTACVPLINSVYAISLCPRLL